MNQRWWWLGFALGVAVIVGAMGWVTLVARDLERSQATARRQAFREENARLALWRLDSLLTPIVAREAARPAAAYRAFMAPEQAFNRTLAPLRRGDVLICSPLLGAVQQEVLVHFQVAPDGSFDSPQVPMGAERRLAELDPITMLQITAHAGRLNELTKDVNRAALLRALDLAPPPRTRAVEERLAVNRAGANRASSTRNGKELAARNQSYFSNTSEAAQVMQQETQQNGSYSQREVRTKTADDPGQPSVTVLTDLMRPLWLGERLLLARRITIDGGEWIQGCWLDWPLLSLQLHETINDILPAGQVQPSDGRSGEHRLAALPLVLLPGDVLPDFSDAEAGPLGTTLLLAWACVALATAAGAGLVIGALRLSARRGAFVSAVTHELRTPLTTFRLYSDLLAGDMVPDERERRRCLDTLRTEADRLSHLVENVLAYARLERTAPTRTEPVGVTALLSATRGRLIDRAKEAGLELIEEHEPAALTMTVRADPQAVERILFNLVDNAAKYAASASDRRLHLEARGTPDWVEITVRDHGPGVPDELRRRMFTPFAKSAEEAARTAPGVGLGLALSRQLARQIGGELSCAPRADGARFVLRLRTAPTESTR